MKPFDRIDSINRQPWKRVSLAGLVIPVAFAGYIVYWTLHGDGWVPLVDDANFGVHEAGHPLVGLFSARLAVYGGTLAQLALPAVGMIEFWRRRDALAYGLCGMWLGQSLLNVARYMADARAMRLPLAGFGENVLHDWNIILARWGLLNQDVLLANGLRLVAWLGIAASLGFVAYRRRQA
jgi:hypothetical protein